MTLIAWLVLCLSLGWTIAEDASFTYMLTVEVFAIIVPAIPKVEHVFDSHLQFFLIKIRDTETGSLHFYKPFCKKIAPNLPTEVPRLKSSVVIQAIIHSSPFGRAGLADNPVRFQIHKSELVSEGTKKLCYTGSYQKLNRSCWTKFKIEWDCADPMPTLWIGIHSCSFSESPIPSFDN
jgi:hypothetical protein